MNQLQQVEFEILKEFVRICDELHLTYYLVCGSALGAVKYQGFIPWDDDIDVALPRADYEIFCNQAQKMLPEHLVLQNNKIEPNYPLIFSKIRHKGTTFIEKSMAAINMNHGIYMDVFPLDGYPQAEKSKRRIEKEKRRYALARLCCLNVSLTWKTRLLVTFQKFIGLHKKPCRFINRLEKQITRYSTNTSEIWCNHGNWQGQLEYADKKQYGQGTWTTFEGLRVRVPAQYDEYLTQKYGDWRCDLPEHEKQGHHYHYICDVQRAYTEYVVETSKRSIQLKNN